MNVQFPPEQRLLVTLRLRIEMLDALWGDEYGDFKVEERCSHCKMRLTLIQILQGFGADPEDTLSACLSCKNRFPPRFVGSSSHTDYIELSLWGPKQTLQRLKGKGNESFLSLVYTSFGRSALIHFGGLKEAFAKIKVAYRHEPPIGWKRRVSPYLGRVPDQMIAEVVGTSRSAIRRLRDKTGIESFSGFTAADRELG
jgi:hypothetical protein